MGNKGGGYYYNKEVRGAVPCDPDDHPLPHSQRIALEALISIAHEAAEVEPEGSGEQGIFQRLEVIEGRVRALFCVPKTCEAVSDEP